jgi:HEAT repeat protein
MRKELGQWFDEKALTPEQKRALDEFSRLLSIARDYSIRETQGKAVEEERVRATDPVIDDLARSGEPAESVVLRLLDARKDLRRDERRRLLSGEDAEVYGAIVLWRMKSRKAVALLMKLAERKEIDNRAVFIRALGRIGDRQALDFLHGLLRKEGDPEIVSMIKEAIGEIEKQNPPPPATKSQEK